MILEIKNISKKYDGVQALDELSFSIEKGTINALIGPNGSGKTTLFNIISGFIKPTSGDIYFNNNKISNIAPYKVAQIGISRTFQNIRIFPQITVLDNMLLATKYLKGEKLVSSLLHTLTLKHEELNNRNLSLKYLKYFGLTEKKGDLALNMSHGQRRLLEIARALATEADLYLFDEPTAGVFPDTRIKIMEAMSTLKANSKTVLFIEHDMKVVTNISDKIIVLNYGKKIAEGNPVEIIKNYDVINAYLGKRYAKNA